MIGDFGPRGKNGQQVDVSSTPYVIGNVPLNEDYTVMVNNGEMRTYQFKIDAYDVTSSNGTPLAGAHQSPRNEYEVDIDHNEMLCGNAGYNAHIRCSAYQTNGSSPNTALVSQDTTFSFTTGPRPQAIQLKNLLYSYPIANQRYLLKNEFGSQGRLVVAQDVAYLLNAGKQDDCSNPAPPSGPSSQNTGSPAPVSGKTPIVRPLLIKETSLLKNSGIVATQLLAKFFPSGGGDTLQTSFSYAYDQNASTGTLQFALPPGLQNTKVYSLQIWVVPPPQAQNNAGVVSSTTNKTLTQTVTTYAMNGNGNLVASQTTKQITERNTINSLNGTRLQAATDSSRCIFSMIFGTSQYNRFADKMAGYGAWTSQDETSFGFDMPLFSNATAVEPFDVFEIQDFKSSCTVNGYSNPVIPHLFNADVPWDPNAHNDEDAGLIYVYASGITALTHASVDLGIPETRGWFGVPTYQLMSLENMPYQPALSLYSNAVQRKIDPSVLANSATNVQPGGNGNKLFSGFSMNNVAYELPKTGNGGILQSNVFGVSYNYASGVQPSHATPKPPSGLLWKRDDYFYNDFMLLKDFVGDLSAKTNLITANTALDLIFQCHSCTVEQVSGYYGSITLTADGWSGVIGSDMTLFWGDVNNFLALPFTPFPPTARRNLHFTYNYPCANCNSMPVEASSSFEYKSFLLPAIGGRLLNGGAGPKNYLTPAGTPAQQPSTPIQPVPVRETLLKKYNIH
jgi:hypothetical protein